MVDVARAPYSKSNAPVFAAPPGTGVNTYLVYPGVVMTDLGRHMGINRSVISSFLLAPVLWCFTLTPRQGIQTTLHCILSEDATNVPGKYWR